MGGAMMVAGIYKEEKKDSEKKLQIKSQKK